MTMPVVIVTPMKWSRSPLQLFLLLLILTAGLTILFGQSQNKVIIEMGSLWSSIWGGTLVISSIVCLAGSYWKDRISGMFIERSGTILLGGSSFLWPILVLINVGIDGAYTAVSTFIFSAFCFWHVVYINRHIHLILNAIDKAHEDENE